MGKYFKKEVVKDMDAMRLLRIVDMGDGFQIYKGGSMGKNGKIIQADLIAYCETKEEAEKLLETLVGIE